MEKKEKNLWSNKVVRVTIKIIIFFLAYLFLTGYHSLDFFKTEKDVRNYLIKYMKEEYNANVKLKYIGKYIISDVCLFGADGSCAISTNNFSVKNYIYLGYDENNKPFYISYKNRSIKFLLPEYNPPDIYTDYDKYKDLKKAERIYKKYFDKVYVFTNADKEPKITIDDDGFISVYSEHKSILVGYDDKLTVDELIDIKHDVADETIRQYGIIFTNDIDVFNNIVASEDRIKAMEYPGYYNEVLDEIGVCPCESDNSDNYVYNEKDKYTYMSETNSNAIDIYTNNKSYYYLY